MSVDAADPFSSTSAVAGRHETVIRPEGGWLDLDPRELLHYRGLVWLLVRRDFVSLYKQTVLGPLWFVLKPLLTTLTFVVIFGRVAGLSTDGLPQLLFYFSGTILWFYFSDTFTKVSNVFLTNASLFRKVYFPRLAVPLSVLVSGLLSWSLQFLTFLAFLVFYRFQGAPVEPNAHALLTPFLLLLLAASSLGCGIFISALTTKYRDLSFLLTFGIQLLMYATPVIYPTSTIPEEYRWLLLLNPLSPIFETFRYGFLGAGSFSWGHLGLSATMIGLILLWGLIIFSRVEKTFVDLV